jgi:hypothetical protein
VEAHLGVPNPHRETWSILVVAILLARLGHWQRDQIGFGEVNLAILWL